MSEEIIDVDVLRIEPNSPDGTLDYYLENVKALCKAFSLSFKIVAQYVDGVGPTRQYKILLSNSSFFAEDTRNVIKTFILQNSMTLVSITTIKMDLCEFAEMSDEGVLEIENLILCNSKN